MIALEIARDADPDLDFEPVLRQIQGFADRVRPRISNDSTVESRLKQINWVLFVEEKFSGNESDYFDAKNSYLHEVIERRTGIPISLSVLYRSVAEQLGVQLWGVNLPAHFLLRVDREDGSPIFVDPFHAGGFLDQDGCCQLIRSRVGTPIELEEHQFFPCSTTEIVDRMLRNLKGIFQEQGDPSAAFPVLRRLVVLHPEVSEHRRDLGIVCVSLELGEAAVEHLSAYLEQANQPSDARAIRELIQHARRIR